MKPRPSQIAAHTLAEVMIASALCGVVLVLILPFFLTNSKLLFVSGEKLLVNGDVRTFTNAMIQHVEGAGNFVLYQSFYPHTLVGGTNVARDANADGVVNALDYRQSGQSGDFVVLVYYQDPFFDSRFYDATIGNEPSLVSGNATVDRIVAYWLAPNRTFNGETALYRLDSDDFRAGTSWTTPWGATFPADLSAVTLESLLPSATASGATDARYAHIVLNNLVGLSTGLDFVNFQGRSLMIRSRILHGNQAKRVTNTYNFTVSPRG